VLGGSRLSMTWELTWKLRRQGWSDADLVRGTVIALQQNGGEGVFCRFGEWMLRGNMNRRWQVGVCLVLLVSCTEVETQLPFVPPLLLERDSASHISEWVGPLPLPIALEEKLEVEGFRGVVFDVDEGRLVVEAWGAPPLGVALYGPRSPTGVWGQALWWSEVRPKGTRSPEIKVVPGRYLLVVGTKDSGAVGEGYRLRVSCLGACVKQELPVGCPDLLGCPLLCPFGYVQDGLGCEQCACLGSCGSDLECPAGQACGGDGYCVAACRCSDPLAPVCGTDGVTYGSACEARCAGVEVAQAAPCAATCAPVSCDTPCEWGTSLDGVGCPSCECRSSCSGCGTVTDPVCTYNGRTYGNRCWAECVGEVVLHWGACREECPLLACDLDCVPELSVGEDGCPICACGSTAMFCAVDAPVCGWNGATYSSACAALEGGVAVMMDGACPSTLCREASDCPEGMLCGVGSGVGCEGYAQGCVGVCLRELACDEDGGCAAGYFCQDGRCQSRCACSRVYEPVCGVDGQSYDNACVAACAGIDVVKLGRCCEAVPCSQSCPMGYARDVDGCLLCECANTPSCVCTDLHNPVCGLWAGGVQADYANACLALCAGAQEVSPGPCGS